MSFFSENVLFSAKATERLNDFCPYMAHRIRHTISIRMIYSRSFLLAFSSPLPAFVLRFYFARPFRWFSQYCIQPHHRLHLALIATKAIQLVFLLHMAAGDKKGPRKKEAFCCAIYPRLTSRKKILDVEIPDDWDVLRHEEFFLYCSTNERTSSERRRTSSADCHFWRAIFL